MKKLIAIILSFICYGGSICYGQDIVKKLREEKDGFKWYELTKDYTYYGAEDINGKTLIPLSEKMIIYRPDYKLFQITLIKDDLFHGFCDLNGKELITPGRYDEVSFRGNYFDVKKGNFYGICDKSGKEIIPLLYDEIYESGNKCFKVKKGKFYGICDITGKFLLPLNNQYTLIHYIPQIECYSVHKGENCRGVVKKDGSFLIPLSRNYEICNYEKEGWFYVMKNGLYGACDLSGKEIIKTENKRPITFNENTGELLTFDENFNPKTYQVHGLTNNPTNAVAQNNLGAKYYNEKKNYSEAIKWFRKSAAQGNMDAEFNMGICYEYGNGTTKNLTEAISWYKKAQNHGHPNAAKRIAELTKTVTPPQTYTAQTQTTKPQKQTLQVQKFHDALAFELLDDGMKECKLKHEYYGGSAVIVDLSFLMNYTEIYKFSRDGQLTNAAEIGITNIQRNKDGCIISYKKDDCTYKLEYESLPTKAGINSIRLKRLSWGSPEPCEYRYVKLDDAELMSGIWVERHYYKNGKLEEKEKIEQRWDENYLKNHKKYFYFFPASEKKATEKNIKECVTCEPIYWK